MKTMNKRERIGGELFDFMLLLIGKTRVDILGEEHWRRKWSLTRNQYDILRDHSIKECKKVFKYRREKAEATFEWFFNEFGVKIKN